MSLRYTRKKSSMKVKHTYYEVKQIMSHIKKEDGFYFSVQWKGFPADPKYYPEENFLNCHYFINRYLRNKGILKGRSTQISEDDGNNKKRKKIIKQKKEEEGESKLKKKVKRENVQKTQNDQQIDPYQPKISPKNIIKNSSNSKQNFQSSPITKVENRNLQESENSFNLDHSQLIKNYRQDISIFLSQSQNKNFYNNTNYSQQQTSNFESKYPCGNTQQSYPNSVNQTTYQQVPKNLLEDFDCNFEDNYNDIRSADIDQKSFGKQDQSKTINNSQQQQQIIKQEYLGLDSLQKGGNLCNNMEKEGIFRTPNRNKQQLKQQCFSADQNMNKLSVSLKEMKLNNSNKK